MNNNWKPIKLKTCTNIINNKNRGILSVCGGDNPISELVFYDTDYFCGCFFITFKVCQNSRILDILDDDNRATLSITQNCGNNIKNVILEGTLDYYNEETCCCNRRDECFVTIRMNVDKVKGRKYSEC